MWIWEILLLTEFREIMEGLVLILYDVTWVKLRIIQNCIAMRMTEVLNF